MLFDVVLQTIDESRDWMRTIPNILSHHEEISFQANFKNLHRNAEKYVLLDQATRMASMMANKAPTTVLHMINEVVSQPPMKPVWIEWQEYARTGEQAGEMEDKEAGFLCWTEFSSGGAVNFSMWGSKNSTHAGNNIIGFRIHPAKYQIAQGLGTNEENLAIDLLDTQHSRLMGWDWISQNNGDELEEISKRISWIVTTPTGLCLGRKLAKYIPNLLTRDETEDLIRTCMDVSQQDMRYVAAIMALLKRKIFIPIKKEEIPEYYHRFIKKHDGEHFTMLGIQPPSSK